MKRITLSGFLAFVTLIAAFSGGLRAARPQGTALGTMPPAPDPMPTQLAAGAALQQVWQWTQDRIGDLWKSVQAIATSEQQNEGRITQIETKQLQDESAITALQSQVAAGSGGGGSGGGVPPADYVFLSSISSVSWSMRNPTAEFNPAVRQKIDFSNVHQLRFCVNNQYGGGPSSTIELAASTDLQNWSTLVSMDYSVTGLRCSPWIPYTGAKGDLWVTPRGLSPNAGSSAAWRWDLQVQ
jgi:hypothetical protein